METEIPMDGKHMVAGSLTLALLAACSGDSGTSSLSESLTIKGVAATGAAMAKANIKVKCASGEGTTNSGDDGAYQANVRGGALPCLIEATSADGMNVLHSVAPGTGFSNNPVVANVSPITTLVVAMSVGSGDTATVFKDFSASVQGKLTTDKVTTAVTNVKLSLANVDAGVSNIDPLKGTFTAATAESAGDATDKIIDKIVSALAQNAPGKTTLVEQVKTFATTLTSTPSTSGSSGSSTSSALPALPVPSCPGAKNVPYRLVGLGGGVGLSKLPDMAKGTIDMQWSDGTTESNTFAFSTDATRNCQFTLKGTGNTLNGAFASSGVFVVQDAGSPTSQAGLGIGFPDQTIPLADLAGTWNMLEYSKDGTNGWMNFVSQITVDTSGKISNVLECTGISSSSTTCPPATGQDIPSSFSVHPKGGFSVTQVNGVDKGARIFTYRTSTGEMMLVAALPTGGLIVGAKQNPLVIMPSVGSVTKFWEMQANINTAKTALVTSYKFSEMTVQSVNASTKQVTRIRDKVDGVADGRVDTVTLNQPRAGLRFRPAGSYTLNGSATTYADALQIPMPGINITVTTGVGGVSAANKFLHLSVMQ